MLSPVNPASKTFSQSVPNQLIESILPCVNVEVVHRRRLYTEGLGKLVKRLAVAPNGILGEKLASDLQLIFEFPS